jgi:hypothetical protein
MKFRKLSLVAIAAASILLSACAGVNGGAPKDCIYLEFGSNCPVRTY